MRMHTPALRVLVALSVALCAATHVAPLGAHQISAGILATWKDLDTWTNYHDDSRETEKGLGLILGGSGGEMRLGFSARLAGRFPNKPPAVIRVEASADPRSNPNTLRWPALRFHLDEHTDHPLLIDLSDRMTVDNPAPGAMVNNSVAQMTPDDLLALLDAKTVSVNIFQVDVAFREDQLKALAKYADSIFVKKKN